MSKLIAGAREDRMVWDKQMTVALEAGSGRALRET